MTRLVAVVGAVAVLLVAMALSTKWLSPEEAAAINPPPFNAEDYAQEQFPKIVEEIKSKAVDLPALATAYDEDAAAACEQYGQSLGQGSCAYPVTFTGEVTAVDANFATVQVEGVPPDWTVRVPLGAAVSGTPVRDATGSITFSDFVGQTQFQSVANQLKIRVQQDVLAQQDPTVWQGQTITVYGAWATGGPPKSFNVQPVSIEVAA
jgi:predicted lipoprotein